MFNSAVKNLSRTFIGRTFYFGFNLYYIITSKVKNITIEGELILLENLGIETFQFLK